MIQKPRSGLHFLNFFVCQLFFLAVVPVVSMGQPIGFDTNGNGLIDDEELTVIINYWAQKKPIPVKTMEVKLPGSGSLELVGIPSGNGIVNGKTVHVDQFWMGKYEITQQQYQAVMGQNPSRFESNKADDEDNPVENVSWNDCHRFLVELNKLGLGHFSLPSEAQWEYACRAGTKTLFFWGSNYKHAEFFSWDYNNSHLKPHGVGTLTPNPWGLYDMTGNVWEWCEDLFSYTPIKRVVRGGCWDDAWGAFKSSYREGLDPDRKDYFTGFRVVRTP